MGNEGHRECPSGLRRTRISDEGEVDVGYGQCGGPSSIS